MSDGSSIITQSSISASNRSVGPLDTPDPTTRYVFEITPLAGIQPAHHLYVDGSEDAHDKGLGT